MECGLHQASRQKSRLRDSDVLSRACMQKWRTQGKHDKGAGLCLHRRRHQKGSLRSRIQRHRISYIKRKTDSPCECEKGKPFIEPTFETTIDGSYPLRRHLYLYVNKAPKSVDTSGGHGVCEICRESGRAACGGPGRDFSRYRPLISIECLPPGLSRCRQPQLTHQIPARD